MKPDWLQKVTIPVSALTSIDYLIYYLNLMKAQANNGQLPVVEIEHNNDAFLLLRKSDFVERFGE